MSKKGNAIDQAQKKIASAMKKEPSWLVATKNWMRANVADADSLPYDNPNRVAFSMTLAEILNLARHVAEVQYFVQISALRMSYQEGIDAALSEPWAPVQETKEKTNGG